MPPFLELEIVMKTKFHKTILGLAVAIALTGSQICSAADLTGGGATAPATLFSKWAEAYQAKTGVTIQYQAIGSGAAIDQTGNKTLDFGVSDVPLKPEELEKRGLMQFPVVVTGLVSVIHLEGIPADSLKLDGATLADIYLGKITKWNDPALVALNPDLKLPDQAIAVVHRSDAAGSSFVFTNYLSKVSPAWKTSMGEGMSVAWKAGQIEVKGNDGMTKAVQQTQGAIAYVGYSYAVSNKLSLVLLKNRAGQFVKPEDYGFQVAVMGAEWRADSNFYTVLTDEAAKDVWPMNAITYVLLRKVQENADKASKILKFIDWIYHDNNDIALQLGFIPLPDSLDEHIELAWKTQLKDSSGKPIWH